MLAFKCSYAIDYSSYYDFQVSAVSEMAARRKINRALRAGRFDLVQTDICWDNASRPRVFICEPLTRREDFLPEIPDLNEPMPVRPMTRSNHGNPVEP